jgi:predicted phosphodiesterase
MRDMNELAVISDIHGNRWALEAVLQDIRARGIEEMVNLGDTLYGPLDPAGTAELLLKLDIPTVRGNQDRMLVEPAVGERSQTIEFVLQSLSTPQMRWLEELPLTTVVQDEVLLCHGSPADDSAYLLWDVSEDGAIMREQSDLVEALDEWPQQIILCGHDHMPRTLRFPDGRLIVNPGSVGLPSYLDDEPFPHVMESGSPHARYAVMTASPDGRVVEQIAIPYDWRAAAAEARSNGRDDWAEWLLSGEA